jgi:hypothetical protein
MYFKYSLTLFLLIISLLTLWGQTKSILVEAESFNDKGGWFIDQQSMRGLISDI